MVNLMYYDQLLSENAVSNNLNISLAELGKVAFFLHLTSTRGAPIFECVDGDFNVSGILAEICNILELSKPHSARELYELCGKVSANGRVPLLDLYLAAGSVIQALRAVVSAFIIPEECVVRCVVHFCKYIYSLDSFSSINFEQLFRTMVVKISEIDYINIDYEALPNEVFKVFSSLCPIIVDDAHKKPQQPSSEEVTKQIRGKRQLIASTAADDEINNSSKQQKIEILETTTPTTTQTTAPTTAQANSGVKVNQFAFPANKWFSFSNETSTLYRFRINLDEKILDYVNIPLVYEDSIPKNSKILFKAHIETAVRNALGKTAANFTSICEKIINSICRVDIITFNEFTFFGNEILAKSGPQSLIYYLKSGLPFYYLGVVTFNPSQATSANQSSGALETGKKFLTPFPKTPNDGYLITQPQYIEPERNDALTEYVRGLPKSTCEAFFANYAPDQPFNELITYKSSLKPYIEFMSTLHLRTLGVYNYKEGHFNPKDFDPNLVSFLTTGPINSIFYYFGNTSSTAVNWRNMFTSLKDLKYPRSSEESAKILIEKVIFFFTFCFQYSVLFLYV